MKDADTNVIASRYDWFARYEAHGHSPLYEALSLGVAGDEEVLRFLAELPKPKQQPNLLFAAFRSQFGNPSDYQSFREHLLSQPLSVAEVMLTRSTQTNEPGRCAVLLPLLLKLPQPIALIEVGASAGLCLLPDRYGYDYGRARIVPDSIPDPPIFPCEISPHAPLPTGLPDIVWRAGLDLNPLDVNDSEAMAWLEMLVWPGQEGRRDRLRKAIAVARADPPIIRRGDLTNDLAALLEEAPAEATKVVFHSAVLNYLPSQTLRDAFADQVMQLADHWIANESPLVLPRFAPAMSPAQQGQFLLSLNGEPVAWSSPHGAKMDWLSQAN